MNKKVSSFIAVYAIVFAIFNVIALVLPCISCASRWIIFAFTDIAIILSAGITWIAFAKGENVKSKFYGFPVFRVGFIYVIVQLVAWLIVSCICIAVEVPAWISIIISMLVLGFALIGVIATDNVRDIVEEQDEKIVAKTKAVKTFSVDVESLIPVSKDAELRKAVEKLAEKVKYSDPVSSEATADIEERLQKEMHILASLIRTDYSEALEKVNEIGTMVDERNRLCKEGKQ